MKSCPRISVLLPVYNAVSTLEAVISSLRSQTLSNWECILVNDGSTDDTGALAEKLAKEDTRIIVAHNVPNQGLPATLNKCLFLSRGEFLARADSDDLMDPERFERQIEFLVEHPEVDLVGTGATLNEGGEDKGIVKMPPLLVGRDAASLTSNIVFHSSVMARRSFFEKYGLYDSRFRRSQDRELWIRSLLAGAKIANIQDPLIRYETDGYSRSHAAIRDKTISTLLIGRKYKIIGYKSAAFRGAIGLLLVKWRVYRPKALRRTANR